MLSVFISDTKNQHQTTQPLLFKDFQDKTADKRGLSESGYPGF